MADKVLLIAYYFPPLGAAGAGRALSLFKYLPKAGIECDVLTVKNVAYRFYDHEILKNLDANKIYRAGSFDPQRIMYLLGMRTVKEKTVKKGRGVSKKIFPDPQRGWINPAVKLGRTLLENKQYKLIISTSPPMSAHKIAMKLSGEFKIPWIADFRDYWVTRKSHDWFESERSIKKANKLLEMIINKAHEVVTASEDIAKYFGRGFTIYNSFDSERSKLWTVPDSQDFEIGVLGTINDDTPIEPLFKIINSFKNKKPDLYGKLKINHVGMLDISDMDMLLDKHQLTEKFLSHGMQERNKTIELLNSCSLFYFSLASYLDKGIITSRIFDLIASGRPILASLEKDMEVASILKATGNSSVTSDDDFSSAVDYLDNKMTDYVNSRLHITPLPSYAERFSSDAMVWKYADLVSRLL